MDATGVFDSAPAAHVGRVAGLSATRPPVVQRRGERAVRRRAEVDAGQLLQMLLLPAVVGPSAAAYCCRATAGSSVTIDTSSMPLPAPAARVAARSAPCSMPSRSASG